MAFDYLGVGGARLPSAQAGLGGHQRRRTALAIGACVVRTTHKHGQRVSGVLAKREVWVDLVDTASQLFDSPPDLLIRKYGCKI